MIKDVCIIGAGFAGLTSARVFSALNYNITLYEKEADVGGVWSASRRYPGLTTQNTRKTYELSDFPMPSNYPEWPSGEQVQHYMQSYVDHFNLNDNIHLNTKVVSTKYKKGVQKWAVTVAQKNDDGTIEELTNEFDYLIIGNGIFSVPSVPTYKGIDSFTEAGGMICHTSEFTDKEKARGKNVLVIGYGKSSCDVANAIYDITGSTHVVARNLIWKIPKLIANKLNYKHLFLSRMSEALFRYIHLRGVDKFFHTVGNPIRKSMLSSVEFIVERQLGLSRLGLHPNKPLESIARSTVSLVSDNFYQNIEEGNIGIKKNTVIKELSGRQATLSNGDVVPVDLIVCGTGWKQVCPFLDEETLAKVTDEEGNFRLYRSMLPVGVERLAFNGYNSSFFSQLNCEIGALWLADYINGGFSLPSELEQNKIVDERLAWMEQRTDGKHSKGTNIIPFSIHHIDELLGDMKMNIGRFTRFKQWLGALNPEVYSKILPRLQKKYQNQQ
ncbi:flavin-containing monooxygenase [Veronia pacifica]|uniref:Monooxygenase n=1 Tax=Veronia pacifica TaxID=1080227 RepID=A0A1C3ECB1_9GAMM|nr:NAD(P)/FAD-dependent oxidoreductase [Veronia pacifica]ODA30897.1 monooxygenase [Veronia pacifica]